MEAALASDLGGAAAATEATLDDDLADERLGLIFTACRPMLSPDARAALTLRVVGGLTTDEIARGFLSSEATISRRIVRAKTAIAKASCLIPEFDGAILPSSWRDSLWAKFSTGAPQRQRRSVERYNIVKRA